MDVWEAIDQVAANLVRVGVSRDTHNGNGDYGNIVDGLYAIANALDAVARAIGASSASERKPMEWSE
jgi:hypothetical protein